MNFQDVGNGVHLKYIRMHIIGASGNWWESRVRINDGVYVPPGEGYVISPLGLHLTKTITDTFPGMIILVNVFLNLQD